MDQWVGYLNRASGIVASILIVAALGWGFFFSSRSMGTRLRPAWWLDLHNWLGGTGLIFTVIHVGLAWSDTNAGIGLQQIVVPGTSTLDRWGITWGVLAFYSMIAVVFTTWPRRLGHRTLWRIVHLTSIVGTGLALLHAYVSGSDATHLIFRAGLLVLVGFATYALWLRILGVMAGRSADTKRRPARSSP